MWLPVVLTSLVYLMVSFVFMSKAWICSLRFHNKFFSVHYFQLSTSRCRMKSRTMYIESVGLGEPKGRCYSQLVYVRNIWINEPASEHTIIFSATLHIPCLYELKVEKKTDWLMIAIYHYDFNEIYKCVASAVWSLLSNCWLSDYGCCPRIVFLSEHDFKISSNRSYR